MSEEDKPESSQPKNILKCEQEIVAIMKQMGITKYELETIIKLKEFVCKQLTAVFKEARIYANNSNKESPDVDDVKRAIQNTKVRTPSSQEDLRKSADKTNYTSLPPMKRGCGLRLPPNPNCVSSCDYCLKTSNQEKPNSNCSGSGQEDATKVSTKPNVSCVKMNSTEITKHSITTLKPLANVGATVPVTEKTTLESKVPIQSQKVQILSTKSVPVEVKLLLETKTQDDGDM